jgi:hypothetical protein
MPIPREKLELAIRLTLIWAMAEHALDHCVAVIYYSKGGDRLAREMPLNARAKIKFFRKACNELEFAADVRDHANALADLALKALVDRNWCIHGAAVEVTPEGYPDDIVLRQIARPLMERYETRTVTLTEIARVQQDCTKVMLGFAVFVCEPLGFSTTDAAQRMLDELGIEFTL